jgi:hypothetical protein
MISRDLSVAMLSSVEQVVLFISRLLIRVTFIESFRVDLDDVTLSRFEVADAISTIPVKGNFNFLKNSRKQTF